MTNPATKQAIIRMTAKVTGQPNYTPGPGWQPVRPGATDYQRYPSLGATAKPQ